MWFICGNTVAWAGNGGGGGGGKVMAVVEKDKPLELVSSTIKMGQRMS